MPLLSHTHDCCPPAASVVQRGAQSDCTEASCSHAQENTATGWNAQHAVARSAGKSAERKEATSFASRGRSASL